ncbi:MAG TPA: hypothetical protein VJP83_01340 [Terriglobales bacterium]|nr:hypothetical protein [Terriglobales bacterium]
MLCQQRPAMSVPVSISYLIWVAGGLGNAIALWLMFRRRLLREFPFFFCYLSFHIVEGFISVFLYRHFGRDSWAYLYEWWAAQGIGIGLRFGVIWEIFSHMFRRYEGLRHAGAIVFRSAAVLLVVVAVLAAVAGPAHEPDFARNLALNGGVVLERSLDVVQCGLLLLLFLFASYFALTWRNYVFGIALGFGVIASVELLAAALATQFRSVSDVVLNSLPRIAYAVATIIWVVYLAGSEPPRPNLTALPQHDLEKWNQELLELLHR